MLLRLSPSNTLLKSSLIKYGQRGKRGERVWRGRGKTGEEEGGQQRKR